MSTGVSGGISSGGGGWLAMSILLSGQERARAVLYPDRVPRHVADSIGASKFGTGRKRKHRDLSIPVPRDDLFAYPLGELYVAGPFPAAELRYFPRTMAAFVMPCSVRLSYSRSVLLSLAFEVAPYETRKVCFLGNRDRPVRPPPSPDRRRHAIRKALPPPLMRL